MEALEADVPKLERDLAAVKSELGADHHGDWQKLHTLAHQQQELAARLERRMSEWEAATAALLASTRLRM